MVSIGLLWVLVAVLVIKLIGNILVPYEVLRMKESQNMSIGLVILVDLLLFLCIVGLAWFISESGIMYNVGTAALVAGGAILATYIHYFGVLAYANMTRNGTKEDDG